MRCSRLHRERHWRVCLDQSHNRPLKPELQDHQDHQALLDSLDRQERQEVKDRQAQQEDKDLRVRREIHKDLRALAIRKILREDRGIVKRPPSRLLGETTVVTARHQLEL